MRSPLPARAFLQPTVPAGVGLSEVLIKDLREVGKEGS